MLFGGYGAGSFTEVSYSYDKGWENTTESVSVRRR